MSSTCGYLCPQCEGKGFVENGEPCDWCSPLKPEPKLTTEKPSSDAKSESPNHLLKKPKVS